MMFVSENHGYVTVCHGDDFVSSGAAAALDEIDRVRSTDADHERRRGKDGETSMTTWSHTMRRPSDRRQAQDSVCRSIVHHTSLQCPW